MCISSAGCSQGPMWNSAEEPPRGPLDEFVHRLLRRLFPHDGPLDDLSRSTAVARDAAPPTGGWCDVAASCRRNPLEVLSMPELHGAAELAHRDGGEPERPRRSSSGSPRRRRTQTRSCRSRSSMRRRRCRPTPRSKGKIDRLNGLTENVIIGTLIRAARGLNRYRRIEIEPAEPFPARDRRRRPARPRRSWDRTRPLRWRVADRLRRRYRAGPVRPRGDRRQGLLRRLRQESRRPRDAAVRRRRPLAGAPG